MTNGTFGKTPSEPTFDKTTADTFHKSRYEKPTLIDPTELTWFPKVDEPTVPYNLKPYNEKDIQAVLKKKDKNLAPGEDNIVYEYLQRMPYLQEVLATTFTRIRDKGVAPNRWGVSKVILIKKDEETPNDEPTNFRMISLSLNIGKLYHTLEAQRTIDFMVS